MKITILVPSAEYLNNAGARIRYSRLSAGSGGALEITLQDIAQFDADTVTCDVLVISKCHDARALLAAVFVRQRGIRVGVDLFDDYFGQADDSRLVRFRRWLGQLLPLCDFAMCSTALMADVIHGYRPGLAVHVLKDPVVPVDYSTLSSTLSEKLRDAQVEGRLRLAWFGVGDNPHFPIGLSDLAAFSDALARLGKDGREVELSILTNERALTADRLAMIGRLPVQTKVEIWSEQAEGEALAQSLACFLPVNAQQFSIAKSLNRALTALTAGCQVISSGYPLYDDIAPFVYRDIDEFIDHVGNGSLRLAPSSLAPFRNLVEALASPEREAQQLSVFLGQIPVPSDRPEDNGSLFLLHGVATNGAAHKTVRRMGGLSVASPFCPTPLGFDIVFQVRPGRGLAMLVSDRAVSRLREEVRGGLAAYGEIGTRMFWEVRRTPASSSPPAPRQERSLSLDLALYPAVMHQIVESLTANFGKGRTIISDNTTLPFDLAC